MFNDLFWRGVASIVSRPAVADWLIRRSKRTVYRPIPEDGSYMERWWLFNPYEEYDGIEIKEWDWLPSIRIHHIKRKDRDRHFHDHPWDARTIILKNFYDEVRLEVNGGKDFYVRSAGDTTTLKFGEFHRITYVPPEGVWTLFITWKYRGVWGFLVDGVKIPWCEYLSAGNNQ